MSDERLSILLKRELDGVLTPVESEELERLSLFCPEARGERRAWRRVERGLKNALDQDTELDLEALNARITSARAAPVLPPPPVQRWSPALAGAGLLLVAAVVWTHVHPRSPVHRPVVVERAPVELDLDDRDAPAGLVTIRL